MRNLLYIANKKLGSHFFYIFRNDQFRVDSFRKKDLRDENEIKKNKDCAEYAYFSDFKKAEVYTCFRDQ